ncbi:MAG: valine--tRNA ligase [Flavobacteriales bacterium]|nr:valine--tRNA ligase [Flavobacteriales bacterium]MCB9447481.1 valine--tRNA ligase [Flavobacteriales bacterium]
MEIAKTYDPAAIEDKWYTAWTDAKLFHSEPDDREPYTVVIPPPNVTGVLHMGHMLNNTIQDVLVRRARMLGKNACWVPGTDHASIATEAKVVAKLREEGIKKSDLTREAFLEHAWAWKEKHGGIILEQLKKLGASCDWDRTRFTMEEDLSDAVLDVFIDLHKKGHIYRGYRMVNWDPRALTAVSDEEVYHQEEQSRLFYVKYAVEGEDAFLEVATTRPETILGDTAVCVHPDDPRFQSFIGKQVKVPLTGRLVPVIADTYVDPEFGTGALKITPAHDVNDYEIGQRHQLPMLQIMEADGTLSKEAGRFAGMERFEARDAVAKALKEEGLMVKIESLMNKVGYSERTHVVIEPRLSMQWFCRMKELAAPALEHVVNGDIRFYPPKFINTYKHWMENVKDWCISRQLWWGQRIPAWYYGPGEEDVVVAKTAEEALPLAREASGNKDLTAADLRQDEDVVDTWFSSWLWPISVFDGFKDPKNKDISYYYPTNDLVTAPEILFFWVARMIMAGYEYRGELPFKNVYLTGIVRDKQGRKMSKSLGNSPDPLELIKKYGADGVRVGMLLCSPAGNDLPFDEGLCEQGRNFNNKLWNAFRLIRGFEVDANAQQSQAAREAIQWFGEALKDAKAQLDDQFDKFRLSDALMTLYKLTWDGFCSWYLEMIKPAKGQAMDVETMEITRKYLRDLLAMLHPFMPFITEELWQNLEDEKKAGFIMTSRWPEDEGHVNLELIRSFDHTRELVMRVRNFRNEHGMSPKDPLTISIKRSNELSVSWVLEGMLAKLANLAELSWVEDQPEGSQMLLVGATEMYIPLPEGADLEGNRKKLEEELNYVKGFLASVEKKLGNERFVSGAPAQVVEAEQKKKADAEARIKVLEAQLAALTA